MPVATAADIIAAVGSKVFIASALPATYDATGFDALTWTEIGMVESVGEFGPDATIGTFTPLSTGIVAKSMGASDYGEMSMVVAKTSNDSGLEAVLAHQGDVDALGYKVELSETGTSKNHRYMFSGLCKACRVNIGQSPEAVRMNITIVPIGAFVEAEAVNT